MDKKTEASSGISALDSILNGVRYGDNIVWQVDTIDEYIRFVEPYCKYAIENKLKLIYFRFAQHKMLLKEQSGVEIYKIDPHEGFETFITKIHKVIEKTGKYGYYVFDSYSELTVNCYSDRMLGNFFILTCPYLFHLETVAYFSLLRNNHSYHAVLPIKNTTQLFLDVYSSKENTYLHPLKVDGRYSPTMFNLHLWDKNNNNFIPVKDSITTAKVITSSTWQGLQSASYRMIGSWDKKYLEAEAELEKYNKKISKDDTKIKEIFHTLMTLMISTEEPILKLVQKYFNYNEIIYYWKRMIGTGRIGGKTVGMLLARAILKKHNPRWEDLLEPHDSFFIGSDVFYSFLVYNDCWLIRQKQKNPDSFLEDIEEAQKRISNGNFPDYIIQRFSDMLDYFGQSPIIVRSSSLLEDNFGNAFAGKYDSVFCANQGDLKHRINDFINAVKVIYASTMSEAALRYRQRRGVLERDEQMALLVQRVSGAEYGKYFFPQLSGVGFSYNPYVWNENIDPDAGMLRLVFGLGTRAVDRADDDYTRVIALNAPNLRPESNFDKVKKYAQRKVDFIDLKKNKYASGYFVDLVKNCQNLDIDKFAVLDENYNEFYFSEHDNYTNTKPWILTFKNILNETNFINDIKEMMQILKKVYNDNVDIEFTANFTDEHNYKINILQCRPFQVTQFENYVELNNAPEFKKDKIILNTNSGVIGHSRIVNIDRIIFVNPAFYGQLNENDKFNVARIIGKITHSKEFMKDKRIMVIGPGRWGSSMPSLGVPVTFSEINNVSVICEIDTMHDGLVPDLSLGTHFFNEMVETNILYLAFFKAKKNNFFNESILHKSNNQISKILDIEEKWLDTIKLLFCDEFESNEKVYLKADSLKQTAVLGLTD